MATRCCCESVFSWQSLKPFMKAGRPSSCHEEVTGSNSDAAASKLHFLLCYSKNLWMKCQCNLYFPTTMSLTNQRNYKRLVFCSCGLRCMQLMYCMCYATSVSAELNYQQLSRLDRVVRVDAELLCC